MKWYYESGEGQAGPVNDEELKALVNSGTVTATTRVRNSGMSDWKEYGSLSDSDCSFDEDQTGSPRAFCCECHRSFALKDMMKYGETWVCAECKPMFVQKLKEGVDTSGMRYAGFWIRFGAYIIDSIITSVAYRIILIPLLLVISKPEVSADPVAQIYYLLLTTAVSAVIFIAYETIFIGKWGATLGKMACKLKIVAPDGSKISYLRAFFRCFAKILSMITFMIGYIIAAFDDEKRSLHDRICSTRVIRK